MRKVEIKGVKNIVRNLGLSERMIMRKAKAGLQAVGELVKTESVNRTPIDTGRLVDSAYGGKDTPVRQTSSGKLWTKVGYDDTIAPYALAVHESPGKLKGKPRANGNGNYWDLTGEPMFLHNAIMSNMVKIKTMIRAFLKL